MTQRRLPAGSKVLFQVQEGGRGDLVWSLKTKQNTGDVYVETEAAKRWLHISLHESGDWQYSPTERGRALAGVEGRFGVSRRREQLAPGWNHGIRIAVARSELLPLDVEDQNPAVVAVPLHPGYPAIAIEVYIRLADAAWVKVESALLVAEVEMGDGRIATIVAIPYDLAESPRDALSVECAQAAQAMLDFGWDGQPSITVISHHAEETHGFLLQVEVLIASDSTPA